MIISVLVLMLVLGISFFIFYSYRNPLSLGRFMIMSSEDIELLFPEDKQATEAYAQAAMDRAQDYLKRIYAIKPDKRTFKNTVEAFDIRLDRFNIVSSALFTLTYVSPDEEMRMVAQEAFMKLQAFAVDYFSHNPELYKAFVEYEEVLKKPHSEALTETQRYMFNQLMEGFKRSGLHLPQEKQERIKNIQKELAEHGLKFEVAINASDRTIEVPKEGLEGLDEDFVASLKRTEAGNYILGTDYPTNTKVMDNCSVLETRKAQYKSFNQRGYPNNEQELKNVIRLRDELAELLGYKSYAHYDIAPQMAASPEAVEKFLDEIVSRAQVKNDQEMELLKKHLPEGVELTADGKFYPWDLQFVLNQYKKNNLSIDESLISEYFPFEATLPALFSIYEQFFGVTFKERTLKVWHPEVKAFSVLKNDQYIGTLFFDLFPRPAKFTHAAEIMVVPALSIKTAFGPRTSAVSIVLANFPSAQGDRPALLTRNDVITFFHEAGHALHELLGATQLASFAGTNTKGDFVEMPSQMLEEWMWDPHILKKVSSHYLTKEPLPDELIEKIIALKHFESGNYIVRQAYYAKMSLQYFLPGAHKDVAQLWKEYHERLRTHIYFDEDNKGYCSFGHLIGYGAKYYGYLWSKVYALDLFYAIKPHGLLNHSIGERYIQEVIGYGGSKDPAQLLENFLKRKPNSDAFFKDLGI